MNYGLTKARVRLAGSAAILALSAGGAMAQEGNVEQVVVSSTRLQTAGFDAPTPTTVVSAADLEAAAKPNVFDTLTQLPALQGSTGVSYNTGSTTTGLIGLSALALRGLSPLRTLVLMDSQRVVPGNYNGIVDVSQMPQMLIERVDVVTGGASASWGSDAVSGVVNFITNRKFEGFKMSAQAGMSTFGDMGNTLFQAAAGTSFAGGRAHFEVAGEYSYSDGLLPHYPVSQQHTTLPENQFGGRNLSRLSGTASYGSAGSTTVPTGMPLTVYGNITQFQTDPGGSVSAAYGVIKSGPLALTAFNSTGQPYRMALAGGCLQNNATGAISGVNNFTIGGPGGGTLTSGLINGVCFGTESQTGDQANTREFTQGLVDPLTRGSLYMRLSYDLTPSSEVYLTVNYGVARTQNTPAQGNSNKSGVIFCDNAYLPSMNLFGQNLTAAQTLAACNTAYAPPTAGSAAFNTAVATGEPTNVGQVPFASQEANIPFDQQMFNTRTTRRYVAGGDGSFSLFGKDWSWDSYFEHGESDASIKIYNEPLSQNPLNTARTGQDSSGFLTRFNMAQDAVVGPNGSIVCRNTTAQLYGCVPYNPFAPVINPASIAYFDNHNTAAGTTQGPTAIQTMRQEAFSFAVNGSPIEDWAGPVAVAAGYEYREEHYSQRSDPFSGGISASTPATVSEPCTDPAIDCGNVPGVDPGGLGAYNAGSHHDARGTYHVNEVFVEVGVPLINNSFWGKADLQIAGRHARYSTAGDANTWKVGVAWDTPIPGIRVRALQSRDIRAPNLSELFAPVSGLNGSFNNDFAKAAGLPNFSSQNIVGKSIGNAFLKPERAQTSEAGIVWQPDFIPGFQASVDYYRILVKGAVQALGSQTVEDLCFQGITTYCAQNAITTSNGQPQTTTVGNTGSVGDPNGVTAIASQPFNSATLLTDGFDLEASYQFDLEDYDIPGRFVFRSLANHVSKYIQDSGIVGTQRNVELAGALNGSGGSSNYNQSQGNILTWKIQETQSYQNDVWGINLTERWYAGGTFTNKNSIVCAIGSCPTQTPAQQLQNPTTNYNYVAPVFYLDVGASWNVSDKTQLYTRIDNIANTMPPNNGGQNVNNTLYDVIGRMYRVGVRFNN